jgi:hypothetical protein
MHAPCELTGDAFLQSGDSKRLEKLCVEIHARLAATAPGDGIGRHISEIHSMRTVKTEFTKLNWNMVTNKPLRSEDVPPSVEEIVTGVAAIEAHINAIVSVRQQLLIAKTTQQELHVKLCAQALEELRSLQVRRICTTAKPPKITCTWGPNPA